MGRVVYLDRIPDCDFCTKEDRVVPAIVDGPTVFRSHAYMCSAHRKRWSVGGPLLAGEHPLENLIALRKPTVMPTAEERKAVMAEFYENVDMEEIHAMVFDMTPCEAVDGCAVEPDGRCEHGYPSKPRAIGI